LVAFTLKEQQMRLALALVSAFLTLAAACGGDYGRATSPSTYPPPAGTPPDSQPAPAPPTPPYIQSIALAAVDSMLVVGDSVQLSVVGLDSAGRQVATLPNVIFENSNAFSFVLSPDGVLTALYSSFRPFRATVTASVEIDGRTLTTSKRFDVRSAAPARFDFLTTLLPESVRPEPVFSAADGIVYLTVTDSGVDFTLLWSHVTERPIGAHIHGPVGFDGVTGVLADFPIGDQFDDHGGIRGTLTASSIRAKDGRGPIAVDSLVTLIRNRAIYVDIHSAELPAGEVRGTPFASGLANIRLPLTRREPAAAAVSRTSRSPRTSRG
jgi:hypothetical protein